MANIQYDSENKDPIEIIELEIADWDKYHREIFARFSTIIERITERLPRFRHSLKNRKSLNAYFQRVKNLLDKANSLEERKNLSKKAQGQIREIRSALAHCYTAIVAFENAFNTTLALLERIPEDTISVSSDISTIIKSKTQEEELLKELQMVQGMGPASPKSEIKSEFVSVMKEEEIEETEEKVKIGDLLVREGIISREQLHKALVYQRQGSHKREHLGSILVRLGYVDEDTISKVLAKQSGYPYIEDLRNEIVHHMALSIIPERLARQHECMPLQIRGNTLRVAISNPYNLLAIEDLKLVSNCALDIVVSSRKQIFSMIHYWYNIKV
ncbi:MAG TPA: hypothetical protein PLT82_12035 [Candidatus Hydrogenedens sp.]|nr:hypothetical protein [Candidatus Hydrogenedens sp.]HOK10322.1 hypothetical protein [Candidatus Hydrogenedens sp.]HOL20308.1 hypothetical protein [Candidatus Hydrogenedens sp.]HPP59851.1 hypothetical protein [Candidatus Hydrogenedens sp.]